MRTLAFPTSIFAILLAAAFAQADPGDYLEIYPERLRVHGMAEPFIVEEGQSVQLFCDWVVTTSNRDRQWYAGGKEHRFSVRILVDGTTAGFFEGVLGPRTRIGKAEGSRGFAVTQSSGAALWMAKGPGEHNAVCVVNEPKTVSDRWPQNNTTKPVTIRVTSKNPPVKGSLKRPSIPPAAAKPATQPATQTRTASVARRPAASPRPTAPVSAPPKPEPVVSPTANEQPPVPTAAVLLVEAEKMIPSADISGGQMVRQEMSVFGNGWGGDAQLFWRPPPPGADNERMTLAFDLPSAGTYALVLFYTLAPDFGQFTVSVNGNESSKADGYGPRVSLSRSALGRYQLAAGRNEFTFLVTGKNQRSTDYVLGLDRIELTPVTLPN